MPIKAACPRCDRVHTLADDLLGKKIRCKGCEAPFTVEEPGDAEEMPTAGLATAEAVDLPRQRAAPAEARRRPRDENEEDDRPRRRSRDRNEDDYDRPAPRRRKQSSNSSLFLIIGLSVGGVLLLVIIVGVAIGAMMRSAADNIAQDIANHANDDAFRMPGQPPPNFNWNQIQKGMTFEQVVALAGQPAQDHTWTGIEVIHAGLQQQEAVGPDGREKPVRRLLYFKGQWQPGFVDVILMDGRVYKVNLK